MTVATTGTAAVTWFVVLFVTTAVATAILTGTIYAGATATLFSFTQFLAFFRQDSFTHG